MIERHNSISDTILFWLLEKKTRTVEGRVEILKRTYNAMEEDFSENNYPTNVYEWFRETLKAIPNSRLDVKVMALFKEAIQDRLLHKRWADR